VSISLVLPVFRGLPSAGLQTATFFYNRTNHMNKQKAVYSFIINMSGMHKR